MKESPDNLETIREYLLGRILDEKTLEGMEDLLFSDDDFCTKAEILEDELINDYVFGNLSANDYASFEKTLENNKERRLKVQVTQALKEKVSVKTLEEKTTIFDSIKAFFRSPIYAGGFALLLIAALIGTVFLIRSPKNDELAELRNIYAKERPIEPRISGFDYAPMNITRGENKDDANKNKLEEIKLERLKAVNSNPNAENYHALGVFYLTLQNYKDAIENLEKAVRADDKNARFQNDLGSAYLALSEKDKGNLQQLLNLIRTRLKPCLINRWRCKN
jgi:tetratricopeptide (TPR) repeat protein